MSQFANDFGEVCFGFDVRFANGGFTPNGVDPKLWVKLTEAACEGPIQDVHFRFSRLPHFTARSGFSVSCHAVDQVTGLGRPWFYLLRPFAVPELTSAFAALAAPVVRELHAGRCYILIDYAHEGYSNWMFERVYEALKAIRLPRQQVILLSGDLNAEHNHRLYVEANRIRSSIRVHSLNYFKNQVAEHMASDSFRSSHITWEQAATKTARRRFFLNFNRRNRLHRILTVVLLHRRGLLNRGLISMAEQFENLSNEEVMENDPIRFGLSSAALNELRAGYKVLRPLLPLTVDTEEMTTNHAHTHPTWPYLESWLSLVSESLFFESAPGQVFLSEKVWKPMINYHPFLVIGDRFTLRAVKQLGFETFDPYINESYDSEPSHERRLNMVLDEINRLSCMSEKQCHIWFTQMRDILTHNFERLRANHFDKNFQFWVKYFGSPTQSK